MSALVLALILITGEPGTPLPLPSDGDWPAVLASVRRVALAWQLLDAREERLRRPQDFAADLTLLRERYRELAGAPPIHDALRLPGKVQVTQWLDFNRAYRRHLEGRRLIDLDRGRELGEALRETDELYRVWEAVRDAGSDVYFIPVRRKALAQIKDRLGESAYFRGQLPPPVPVWRFEEAR